MTKPILISLLFKSTHYLWVFLCQANTKTVASTLHFEDLPACIRQN